MCTYKFVAFACVTLGAPVAFPDAIWSKDGWNLLVFCRKSFLFYFAFIDLPLYAHTHTHILHHFSSSSTLILTQSNYYFNVVN